MPAEAESLGMLWSDEEDRRQKKGRGFTHLLTVPKKTQGNCPAHGFEKYISMKDSSVAVPFRWCERGSNSSDGV
jgi:hypothetical protein